MPTYNVTDPSSGRSLKLTGDSPPTEQELNDIFGAPVESKEASLVPKESTPRLDEVFAPNKEEPTTVTNPLTEFGNEAARGVLSSTESSVNAVSGATKAIRNMTGLDLDQGGMLERINNGLKAQIDTLPQSDNPFISVPANLIGAAPMAMAQFAGSGGPAGFIARSAILGAAEAYNKKENIGEATIGAVEGGLIAAGFEAAGPLLKMTAKALAEKGPAFAKTILRQQTNLSEEEVITAIENIDKYNLNPLKTRNEFMEAKALVKDQLSIVKDTNSEILSTREKQLNESMQLAKDIRKTSLLGLDATKQETLDNLKISQQSQASSGTEAVASQIVKQQMSIQGAKESFQNEVEAVLGGTVKKLDLTQKALNEEINSAMTLMDAQGTGYVPTNILEQRASTVKNSPAFKDLFETSKADESTLRETLRPDEYLRLNQVARGFGYKGFSTFLKEADPKIVEGVKTKYPEIFNKPETVAALGKIEATGEGYKKTATALNTIFNTIEKSKVEGVLNIRQVEELKNILENAYESASPARKTILSDLKKMISPSNIYRDGEAAVKRGELDVNPVAHLQPLADANLTYSNKIDNLREALKLISDDQGNIKADNLFSIFEGNKKYQQAKLLTLDKALPEGDRIFSKLKDLHATYRKIKEAEEASTLALKTNIRVERNKLNKKYLETARQLREQRSMAGLEASKADKAAIKSRETEMEALRQQKSSEYDALEEDLNKRLNYLKIEDALTRTATPNNPVLGYIQRHAVWSSVLPMMSLHNPIAAIPGAIGAAAISPVGTANLIKAGKLALKGITATSEISKNKALKSILTSEALTSINQ